MKKDAPLETVAETKFSSYINDNTGDTCLKVYETHWPDRIIFVGGLYHFFIEFKRKGETLRPGQVEQIKRLKKQGHNIYVCEAFKHAMSCYSIQRRLVVRLSNKIGLTIE